MDFFGGQEAARRASRRMVVLFGIAVLAIVVAVNAAVALAYLGLFAHHAPYSPHIPITWASFPHLFFETNTVVVLGIICGGTVMQVLELRGGGEAVARMVGARAVDPGSHDVLERRLLNVVEEMAIASGIPAPRAFVLDDEEGINAFAAGNSPSDAIVAVTRGTLERLTRDELQGVVGHEFSHILNGDMTLNLQLIGVLNGLLMLALFGRFLMSLVGNVGDRVRNKDAGGSFGAAMFGVGLAVLAIGYIGVFFGRLIKSSISRQREFLADASSVQFTRNPEGIGNALRKIGGLGVEGGGDVEHLHAESLSHMFLAPVGAGFLDGMFASHPPLDERIARVFGRPMDLLPAPVIATINRWARPGAPELAPLDFDPANAAPASAPAATPTHVSVADSFAANPVAAIAAAGAMAGAPSTAGGSVPSAAVGGPPTGTATTATVPGVPTDRSTLARPASGLPGLPAAHTLSETLDRTPLRAALGDATRSQLLVFALLLEKEGELRERQMAALTEAFGADATAPVVQYQGLIAQLPPGWRLALLDLAMPALRTLDAAGRDRLLRVAHMFIMADGKVTLSEFLLFAVLRGRLAPPAGGGARMGRMLQLADVRDEAATVVSLIATVRLPQDAARAYALGAALLPDAGALRAGADLALPRISAAFERLAQLAPLQKPVLVKACMAAAFVDGRSQWKAASCLRSLCAALDCPLPVAVEQTAPDDIPAAA